MLTNKDQSNFRILRMVRHHKIVYAFHSLLKLDMEMKEKWVSLSSCVIFQALRHQLLFRGASDGSRSRGGGASASGYTEHTSVPVTRATSTLTVRRAFSSAPDFLHTTVKETQLLALGWNESASKKMMKCTVEIKLGPKASFSM